MADFKAVPSYAPTDAGSSTPPGFGSPISVELGGRIPKAGFFFGGGPIGQARLPGPPNGAPEGVNCELGLGAWDGTNQWSMYAVNMGDAPVQTVAWSNGRTDRAIIISNSSQGSPSGNGSGTFKEAVFNAFNTNSASLRWPKQDAVYEPDVGIIMFAGDDLQVHAGVTPSLGAGAGTTTVTGVGFKPDVVFFGNYGGGFANVAVNTFNFSIGVALLDGTQMCTAWRGGTLQSPTTKMTQSIISNRASAMATIGAATLDYTCLVNNFTNDGFDVVTDASASNAKLGFLALKFNGLQTKLWQIATPAATGVQADNTPNFQPGLGFTCMTGLTAFDTPVFDNQNGNGLTTASFSDPFPFVISAAHRINVVRDSHTQYTCNTSFQRGIRTTKGDNGELCNAINPTFTTTGWTLNYTTTDATPRMGWALAIEKPPNSGSLNQTLPSLSQSGFAFCGTQHREVRVLVGNGTFTIPQTWNNADYKIEGISGGQPGDTPLVTRFVGGDGGCGAPYGYSTSAAAGNFSVGDVLTYHSADWTNPVAPRTLVSDDWQGGDESWVKKPDTSYAFLLPGGQQHYNNTITTAPTAGVTSNIAVLDSITIGSIGGAIGTISAVTGPHVGGCGGGGASLSGLFSGGPAGLGFLSTPISTVGVTAAPAAPYGAGSGTGGAGGAGFTINTDETGAESRDGLFGIGGTTTTSAGNGGSVGSFLNTANATADTLINGGAEGGQMTPFPGNWWVDTASGLGAAPAGGGAGPSGALYIITYLNPPGISTKSALSTFLGNATDWGGSLQGTVIGTGGVDGGIFGGGGAGGGNGASTNQADMGAPGRGGPGVIVISWTPIASESDTLGITDVVDAGLSGSGNLSDTLMVSDVVDATLSAKQGPKWLTIGGDSSDSIFPN